MNLRILDRLGVLLDPRFWRRSCPVDHDWSDWLDENMDNMAIEYNYEHYIYFVRLFPSEGASRAVSILNWPNDFGRELNIPDDRFRKYPRLPRCYTAIRRRTAIRLRKRVQALAREAT